MLINAAVCAPPANAIVARGLGPRARSRDGLTPLFWTNIAPYGEVRLNMNNRLALCGSTAAPPKQRR
jgi:hypothetical protein